DGGSFGNNFDDFGNGGHDAGRVGCDSHSHPDQPDPSIFSALSPQVPPKTRRCHKTPKKPHRTAALLNAPANPATSPRRIGNRPTNSGTGQIRLWNNSIMEQVT